MARKITKEAALKAMQDGAMYDSGAGALVSVDGAVLGYLNLHTSAALREMAARGELVAHADYSRVRTVINRNDGSTEIIGGQQCTIYKMEGN